MQCLQGLPSLHSFVAGRGRLPAPARCEDDAGGEYVFCVAQIVNLLYRRLAIGLPLVEIRRPGQGAVLQAGILRYSRLAVCATLTVAALNTYGGQTPPSLAGGDACVWRLDILSGQDSSERQRRSGTEPKVGAQRLPWV